MELKKFRRVTKSLIKFGVLFFVIVMFATSCDRGGGRNPTEPNNNSSLVGTWVLEQSCSTFTDVTTITVRSNGTFTETFVCTNPSYSNEYNYQINGTYTVSNDKLILIYDDGEVWIFTFIIGNDSKGTFLLLIDDVDYGTRFYKR